VIVVGAGPAGATAARVLAEGGLRVLLLERRRLPRQKPCGGGISARMLARFPTVARALDRIPTHWISRLHLEAPDGASVTLESPEPAALMIRRVEFDALLVALAREAGVEVRDGVDISRARRLWDGIEVTSREGRTFRAPLLVAADGVHSPVARRLGLRSAWPAEVVALDMMEETPNATLAAADPSTMWVSYGYGGEGYAYVFPKRHHVNAGVGYLLSYYKDTIGEAPYALQQRFVDALVDRGVLRGASSRADFTPFLIPVGGPARTTGAERVLVAGDAGGFVNAFTAEGIYYAMVTGDLAARALLETPAASRHTMAPAVRYRRSWRREIGAELADSVRVQRFLFADPTRIGAVVRDARMRPATALAIVDYLRGARSYRAARARLLLRRPRLAWALARSA
jgi:geranylgeranyl reductase family protein